MQKVIRGTVIAAFLGFVAGGSAGCSAIGYVVGGAIDGGMIQEVDALSVTRTVDSSGLEDSYWDDAQLALLVKEASPREGSSVHVLTRDGSFEGNFLTVDTALGILHKPADTASAGFLRSELVTMTVQSRILTHVRGRVLGRTGKTVLVWVDGNERRRLPLDANVSIRSERGVPSDGAPELPGISGRLVRVPGLVIGEESPPLFFAFGDVERISVVRSAGWGTARWVGVVIGAVLDVKMIIGLINLGSAGSSAP
jgi:hypothetical protein